MPKSTRIGIVSPIISPFQDKTTSICQTHNATYSKNRRTINSFSIFTCICTTLNRATVSDIPNNTTIGVTIRFVWRSGHFNFA